MLIRFGGCFLRSTCIYSDDKSMLAIGLHRWAWWSQIIQVYYCSYILTLSFPIFIPSYPTKILYTSFYTKWQNFPNTHTGSRAKNKTRGRTVSFFDSRTKKNLLPPALKGSNWIAARPAYIPTYIYTHRSLRNSLSLLLRMYMYIHIFVDFPRIGKKLAFSYSIYRVAKRASRVYVMKRKLRTYIRSSFLFLQSTSQLIRCLYNTRYSAIQCLRTIKRELRSSLSLCLVYYLNWFFVCSLHYGIFKMETFSQLDANLAAVSSYLASKTARQVVYIYIQSEPLNTSREVFRRFNINEALAVTSLLYS